MRFSTRTAPASYYLKDTYVKQTSKKFKSAWIITSLRNTADKALNTSYYRIKTYLNLFPTHLKTVFCNHVLKFENNSLKLIQRSILNKISQGQISIFFKLTPKFYLIPLQNKSLLFVHSFTQTPVHFIRIQLIYASKKIK